MLTFNLELFTYRVKSLGFRWFLGLFRVKSLGFRKIVVSSGVVGSPGIKIGMDEILILSPLFPGF
jgi:hypothetical protein